MYELDETSGFYLDNGERLEGQALINHLITNTSRLKDKVKVYRQKCDDLQQQMFEEQNMAYKKLQNLRSFYKYMLFSPYSRGGTMLKLALKQ